MTFNTLQFAQVVEAAKAKAAGSAKWVRAIVAAGVAAYQASLPDFARDTVPQFFAEPLTAEEAQVEFNTSRETEERQRELCLTCPLADCIGVEHQACPIHQEACALWRNANHRRN